MNGLFGPGMGLGSIHLLSESVTRSISAENPTGEVGGGALAVPQDVAFLGGEHPSARLGKGWKVRPCMQLDAGSVTTIADVAGPGTIQHIWITVREEHCRTLVLRIYWDDEKTPSVEVPLGDFFCNVHGLRYNVNSLPICVNPTGAFNCYWPMPFRQHARVTIENLNWEPVQLFFYQITYALGDVPDEAAYFHAQWRRSMTSREVPEHVILDNISGQGQYVGTVLGWSQFSNEWWGEGEVKFYMDGDGEYPTICGTGTEDYFGGAWCFRDTYSTPFLGYPLWQRGEGEVPQHGMYRWHIMDPIRFQSDLKVTVQALGWYLNQKFEPLTDDICSVGYWYQSEPHGVFPVLPDIAGLWPR